MDTADWLVEKADSIGSAQQWEVHQCHYPDAGCRICEAWTDLGQQRVPLAHTLAAALRALKEDHDYSCNFETACTKENCDVVAVLAQAEKLRGAASGEEE